MCRHREKFTFLTLILNGSAGQLVSALSPISWRVRGSTTTSTCSSNFLMRHLHDVTLQSSIHKSYQQDWHARRQRPRLQDGIDDIFAFSTIEEGELAFITKQWHDRRLELAHSQAVMCKHLSLRESAPINSVIIQTTATCFCISPANVKPSAP